MRVYRIVVALAAAFLAGAVVPAAASVSLGAHCANGTVSCSLYVSYAGDEYPAVVLQWRHLNVCDEPWHPVDMEPLPIPIEWYTTYSLAFPAHDPEEWVVYKAFYVDTQGGLHPADGAGWWPSDEVTCANPILVRGYLRDEWGEVWIEPCPDTCWLWESVVFTRDLEPGTWEHLVDSGIPVNIWGNFRDDEMPGASGIWPTAIVPVGPDEGCDPAIATVRATWSGLKAMYR